MWPDVIKEEIADRILIGGYGALDPLSGSFELAHRLGVRRVNPGEKVPGYTELKLEFDEMIGDKLIGRDMMGDKREDQSYKFIVVMCYKEKGDGTYDWLVKSSGIAE